MALTAAILAIASAHVQAVSLRAGAGSAMSSGVKAYDEFRSRYGVNRGDDDHLTYAERAALFEKRAKAVKLHNQNPNRLWTATVNNKFGDYTDEEFKRLLGHRPIRRGTSSHLGGLSFLQEFTSPVKDEVVLAGDNGTKFVDVDGSLASSMDWRAKINLESINRIKDQGPCGSCWAVAAATALEMHAAEANPGAKVKPVSYEQLVDCVENPRKCGGTGGCSGATAELAFQHVADHGIALASSYKGYQSGGKEGHCQASAKPALHTDGFVQVTPNNGQALLEAAALGPVVVSADGSKWSMYDSGIFNDCAKDSIINHAILLVGYGHDEGLNQKYWLIRNSWGPAWGEQGYMRLFRHSANEAFCGMDTKAQDGVACEDDPTEMEVCGMCGILADSAYPKGVQWVADGDEDEGDANDDHI